MGSPRVTVEGWVARALAVNAKWLEIPKDTKSKFKLQCLTCSHEWFGIGNNIQQGHGCPKCAKSPLSYAEWESDGDRVSKGHGCPACANHGYSPNKPGALYVLDFGNGQIGYGISNFPDDRLKTHSKRIAFDNYRLWNFDDGRVPGKIENSIKRQYATAFHVDLKIDGFRTEAIGTWPFAEFCKFVDMLIQSEVTHA